MEECTQKLQGKYECHGHVFMDGGDFRAAHDRHTGGPDEAAVRSALQSLKNSGVRYFREGGDGLGVSSLAKRVAAEYGIEYASPVFAVHKTGRYGGIVGKSFSDTREYRLLIDELKEAGADFLKLIVSGIITFKRFGELSCESIAPDEIEELINIARGEGFSVMVHANGAETIAAASAADSIEHGYFCDERALEAMAKNGCIWVPTISAVEAFRNREGFSSQIVDETLREQDRMLGFGRSIGVCIAPGSDSGAVGVPHGTGTVREYRILEEAGFSPEELSSAGEKIRTRFKR